MVGTLNVEAFKFSLKGIFHFHQNVIDMTVLCLQRETNCIKTMIVIWNILWIGFICICKLSPLHFVEVTPAIFSRERHCESQVSCPKKQRYNPSQYNPSINKNYPTILTEDVTSAWAGLHAGPLSWSNWNLHILLFWREENQKTQKKSPQSKVRNNNKLNPHVALSRHQTWVTMVEALSPLCQPCTLAAQKLLLWTSLLFYLQWWQTPRPGILN